MPHTLTLKPALVFACFVFLAVYPVKAIYVEDREYLNVPESSKPLEGMLPQRGVEARGGRGYLKINSEALKHRHNIRFDTREVEIVLFLKVGGNDKESPAPDSIALWNAYYNELNSYSMDMNDLALRRLWLNQFIGQEESSQGPVGSMLDIVLPVQVPDWMKRFGADKPRLRINGSYKLVVEGSTITGSGAPIDEGWFPSLHMDQQPAFSVKGSIGRLINIEINSEDGFGTNLKEQLKISYKGEGDELEDDIIQEIEAGNTSLSLTGTSLTGYTETHKGIFGLKMRMKFGNLQVTTIASQEGGSQEKQKLGGGDAAATKFKVEDKSLSLHKHFFLQLSDRAAYADSTGNGVGTETYRRGGSDRRPVVYVPVLLGSQTKNLPGDTATAYALDERGVKSDLAETMRWKALDPKEYSYNPNLRMLTVHGGYRSQSVAVRWQADPLTKAENGSVPFSDRKKLILIHSGNSNRASILDNLMWRWVYNIGKVASQDRDRFTLEMNNNEGRDRELEDSIGYVRQLGLEKKDKRELDYDNEEIFDFEQGYLILPCVSNLASGQDFGNCLTPMKRINPNTTIYEKPTDELQSENSTHHFLVFGKQRKSTFDVKESSHAVSGNQCIDITPGTEKLTLNGSTVLEKDLDYEVLYELGQITLTSQRAKDPNAEIDIEYQCTPVFEIKDKILLGTRLEYKLDNISEESMLGATLLYKSQTTTVTTPQLEREPFNQFLWGFNARLAGSPDWMTRAANLVPFVQTEAKSKANFEFEIAQSRYNPNTKNTAYLDDFENSQNVYPLPLSIQNWFQASPPGNNEDEIIYDKLLDYRHKGEFIWHSNLREQYSRIYGSTGNSYTNSREQTLLKFTLKPNDNLEGNSWGGVMRAMSQGLSNQSRKRTLEVVVQGREGNLYVDLGEISEDVGIAGFAPNGRLDSEVQPGDVVNKLDAGLDNLVHPHEKGIRWECKPSCYSLGFDSTNSDPARDKWTEPKSGVTDPSIQINGTEGNNQSSGGSRWDTEDLDGSGILDVRNRYLRYTIPLDSSCTPANYCEELKNGWRKYQLPLYDAGKRVDAANKDSEELILSNVKMVRLWMGKLPTRVSQTELLLARVSLVGNSWEEGDRNKEWEIDSDRYASGDLRDSNAIRIPAIIPDSNRLKVESVNSQEEKRYQASPSSKSRLERDTRNDEPLAERSLVLKYQNLHAGEIVHATRILGAEEKDLTLYQRIQMEIHPDSANAALINAGQNRVSFGLRIGKDIGNRESRDYYEITLPMRADDFLETDEKNRHRLLWEKNSFSVSLQELTDLKNDPNYQELSTRPFARKAFHAGRGDSSLTLSVVGRPSLSFVNWMRLVVYVDSGASTQSGEIWINDLRLEGVDRSLGGSMRTSLQLDFADFINVSGNLTYRNGGFTTMSETKATPANSSSRVDYNTNFSLYANKFFPDQWGLSIPFSVQYNGSLDRPFTRPSSDMILAGNDFDDIVGDLIAGELIPSAADSTDDLARRLSRHFQATTSLERISTSFKKDHRSTNIFTQILLERPELQYTQAKSEALSYYKESNTRNYNTKLLYNLSPFNNPAYKPLGFSEKWKFMPKFIAEFEITPLPEKLNLTVGDLSFVRSQSTTLARGTLNQTSFREGDINVELTHGVDMEWRLLSFFNFGYRLGVDRNFDDESDHFGGNFFTDDSTEGLLARHLVFDFDRTETDLDGDPGRGTKPELLGKKYFILEQEKNREQTFHMDFNPTLLPWFTPGLNFSSGYRHSQVDASSDRLGVAENERPEYFEATSDHNIKYTASFSLPTLLGSLATGTKSMKGLSGGLESVRKGMDELRLRSFDVSYNVGHKFNNERFTYTHLYNSTRGKPSDFYLYQLGFIYDAGGFDELWEQFVLGNTNPERFGYLMAPDTTVPGLSSFVHNVSRTLDVSTGLTIPWIDLGLSGSVKYTLGYNLYRDVFPSDTSEVWPELTFSGSFGDFASKIPVLRRKFRSMTASTTYNYRHEERRALFSQTLEDTKISHKFSPLLRVAATSNNDIRYENSLNLGWDNNTSYEKRGINERVDVIWWGSLNDYPDSSMQLYPRDSSDNITLIRTFTVGDDFSLSFDVETQKGIQFWRYYVKLQNNLRLKLTLGTNYSFEERTLNGEDPKKDAHIWNASAKPELSYSFTSNVDAMFYALYRFEQLYHTASDELTHEIELHGEFTMRF